MSTASPKGGFVSGMSHWYLCVAIAMAAQMLLLLVWSFFGPGNGLDRIMDPVYADTAHFIGKLFFEAQMSLGNAPLGLGLLFLTVMLYSIVLGTIFYPGYKLFVKRSAGKTAAEKQE